jgi:hypothetical protein
MSIVPRPFVFVMLSFNSFSDNPYPDLSRISFPNFWIPFSVITATGQFIPAAKVFHTKEINYALKGPSQAVITENGIQKLGNEILDKSGYGLSLNELNDNITKTNGLGTIDMKDMQLNTKTFGGIRW